MRGVTRGSRVAQAFTGPKQSVHGFLNASPSSKYATTHTHAISIVWSSRLDGQTHCLCGRPHDYIATFRVELPGQNQLGGYAVILASLQPTMIMVLHREHTCYTVDSLGLAGLVIARERVAPRLCLSPLLLFGRTDTAKSIGQAGSKNAAI